MKKFLLENRAKTLTGKLLNIWIAFIVLLLWALFVERLLKFVDYPFLQIAPEETPKYTFFSACIMAPLWEELAFRYAPLTIGRSLGRNTILPIAVLSSIIFGFAHQMGLFSLLMQGVMGFIFSVVYLKNDESLWSSMLLHFMWNYFVLFLVPIW